MKFVRQRSGSDLVSIALCASTIVCAPSVVLAHTNSVGFLLEEGTTAGTFDLEVFYGSWHNNTSPLQEGFLRIWEMTDAEYLTFQNDPASGFTGELGTVVVGDPTVNTGAAAPPAFAPSALFANGGVNYANTANLPSEFVAGENYFYSGSINYPDGSPEADLGYGQGLFGVDGVDFSAGPYTSVDGTIYEVDNDVWGHQSASANLASGNYRFFYEDTATYPAPTTATWDPQQAIRYSAFFTITPDGRIVLPGVSTVVTEDQRPGISPIAEETTQLSILERVLLSSEGAMYGVNGIFTNTAESLNAERAVFLRDEYRVMIVVASDNGLGTVVFSEVEAVYDADTGTWYDPVSGNAYETVQNASQLDTLSGFGSSSQVVIRDYMLEEGENLFKSADGTFYAYDAYLLADLGVSVGEGVNPILLDTARYASSLTRTIDGSITNIITGAKAMTAEAVPGAVTATEFTLPTVDFGDMATTALGAVNTGTITLGVNSVVDKASTTTTRAIAASMAQIGGSADTGALVLNVASNASAVNGSILNTMITVNGSIGSASTTALGAVNTGKIVSGIDAAVQGIVGMSGQNTSGL